MDFSPGHFKRLLAIYQVLPGPEAHELCVHFGMMARGRLGGVLAGLGFMLPGFVLMFLLSWLYLSVGLASTAFQAVFLGIQPAVIALIVRACHRIGGHCLDLNHEGTEPVGNDIAIDLEVTSNRPDCLGHLGVAREVAVLYNLPLKIPAAAPAESSPAAESLTKVALECPDLCSRYTARVIRNVKVGASPEWLVNRLATLGIGAINNVVDITNYVLMETGQPLHAFDLAKLKGPEIIVRKRATMNRLRPSTTKRTNLTITCA